MSPDLLLYDRKGFGGKEERVTRFLGVSPVTALDESQNLELIRTLALLPVTGLLRPSNNECPATPRADYRARW